MAPIELNLTAGLSKFDCPDHYAVLGVPIDSAASVVRKRYLRIARRLHPDSCGPGVDKSLASAILSRMVNPSYEFLSQAKNLDEYAILLRLVGQRYSKKPQSTSVESELAQTLLSTPNYTEEYESAIKTLADQQFTSLENYIKVTDEISDLNLVFLMRREGNSQPASTPQTTTQDSSQPGRSMTTRTVRQPAPSTPKSPNTNSARPTTSSSSSNPASNRSSNQSRPNISQPEESTSNVNQDLVDQYYRRAEELVGKQCYPEAIRELKEILEGNNPIDPSNSLALTLLGVIYQKHLNSPAMARMYFTKALKSDPSNPEAKKGLDAINKARGSTKKAQEPPNAKEKSKGFNFFGLFSGKK